MTRKFLEKYPLGFVYSFEPDPEIFRQLKIQFECEPRVHLANAAASSAAGLVEFHQNVDDAASSLYPRNKTGRRYYRHDLTAKDTITVSAVTLDQFCAEHAVQQINLLKLDVQGGEYEALKGAGKLLVDQAIDVIVTEFFLIPHYEGAPLLDSIWSLLRSHGYEIYDLCIPKYGANGQARWGDAIFVSNDYRRRYLDTFPEEY